MKTIALIALTSAALAVSGSMALAKGHTGHGYKHHGHHHVGSYGPGNGYYAFMPIHCPKKH